LSAVDIAGFVTDLKAHAVEHRFHIHAERHFVETYSLGQTWEVELHPEEACGGLRLMERMVGFDRAILIDAIRSGRPPGTVQTLDPREMRTQHSASAHDVNLPTALALGRRTGARLPPDDQLRVIAVEAEDVETFGETMTAAVEAAVPRAAARVLAVLDQDGEAR